MTRKSLLIKTGIATAVLLPVLYIAGAAVNEVMATRATKKVYDLTTSVNNVLVEESPKIKRDLTRTLIESKFHPILTPEEQTAERKAYDASHNVRYGSSQDRIIPLTSSGNATYRDAKSQK